MALFGDLKHHALADLARVLQNRTGTLSFHSASQGRILELVLKGGQLRASYLDGFPTTEISQVRELLRQLHAQGYGAFDFRNQSLLVGDTSFYDLAFADLIQEIIESDIPENQLPHPDTRFVVTGKPLQPQTTLTPMWTLLQPYLMSGSSATELAQRLNLAPHDVSAALYRLRALDVVTPQRAAQVQAVQPMPEPALPQTAAHTATAHSPSVTPSAAPKHATPVPLVQRLLGALRRLTKGSNA